MLGTIRDYLAGLAFLGRDTKEHAQRLDQLEEKVEALTLEVREISQQLRHWSERDKIEREKFLFQLENALLRLEMRLPAKRSRKK